MLGHRCLGFVFWWYPHGFKRWFILVYHHFLHQHDNFERISYYYYQTQSYVNTHRIHVCYMVTWIPSIYTLFVSIYTSTMDPMVDWPQRKSLANLQQIWDLLGTPGNLAGVGGKPCRANPKKPSLQNPEMTHVTIPMHNQQSLVVFCHHDNNL